MTVHGLEIRSPYTHYRKVHLLGGHCLVLDHLALLPRERGVFHAEDGVLVHEKVEGLQECRIRGQRSEGIDMVLALQIRWDPSTCCCLAMADTTMGSMVSLISELRIT